MIVSLLQIITLFFAFIGVGVSTLAVAHMVDDALEMVRRKRFNNDRNR